VPVTPAAITLVRSIISQSNVRIPRMELYLLLYLADHEYVFPRGLPRPELKALARRVKRSPTRIEHAMRNLVVQGAVEEWIPAGEWVAHYSYNPQWRPDPPKCAEEPESCPP
jgi:hypothetical protein